MKKRPKSLRIVNKIKFIRFMFFLVLVFGLILFLIVNFIKNKEYITKDSAFPEEILSVKVYNQLIEENTPARPGTKRNIKYIVVHETDNFTKGTGAKNHAEFLKNNNQEATSWHYTVDDKEIYHHIPDNEVANHSATKTGNNFGIGIELCVNSDGDFEKTFDNAAKLIAYLLEQYNLNIDLIKTHNDFSR